MFFDKNGKNFARDCSKLASNKSIPRRIVAVLKPKGGTTPY
jgi:hypothetical protein